GGHVGKCAGHGTPIARSEKLPLLEGEERQLVNADEKIFGALILVDVVFAFAVAEARRRTIPPRDDVLRVVEGAIEFARNIAAKIEQKRGFEFGKRAAEKKRVRAHAFVRLKDRFHQKRFRFARAGGAAKETIFCGTRME